MKIRSPDKLNATGRRITDPPAFTLVELLAVIVIIALLAAVALPSALTSNNRAQESQCAGNLRQIGMGLNAYADDANGAMPMCGWPSLQNPWQTYSAARVVPETGIVTRGYMGLGQLFRTKAVPDPKIFYCPGTAQFTSTFSYNYYASGSNSWPSTPVGSGDDQIRTGYNYYPQLRTTNVVVGTVLPALVFASVQLEFGGTFTLVAPAKLSDLDPLKSITTDVVHNSNWSHRNYGSVSAVNALFPDGHVRFQSAGQNPQPFQVWTTHEAGGNIIGNDTAPGKDWRTVMSLWKP